VPFNLCTHIPPIRFLDGPNVLRVKSLPGCCEVHQVGEQNTDDFPLLPPPERRNE
jgi:hypothetical protein